MSHLNDYNFGVTISRRLRSPSAPNSAPKHLGVSGASQIYAMHADMPELTEAHCIAAKAIVSQLFEAYYHREINLVDLNRYAAVEIAVAIIYCDQRICILF